MNDPSVDVSTVGDLYRDTIDIVGDRTVARWLCETAVGLDGDVFLAAADEPVTRPMVAHLDAMLARWRTGEPLQYVLGRWGFRHLDLAVDRRVLIPRPETELVAGAAIEIARTIHRERGSVRLVDLGTGSGAIGLAAASELPLEGTEIWLTDIDTAALDVARSNLAGIGRAAVNVRIARGSWFDALADISEPFDVVVANPPYIADASAAVDISVTDWEPHTALFAGADGLDALRVIVAAAPRYLAGYGALVLEIGADQSEPVQRLLAAAGFAAIEVRPDLAGRPRLAIGWCAGSTAVGTN